MKTTLLALAASLMMLPGLSKAQEMKTESPFTLGAPMPEAFAHYFSGQAWLASLTHEKALNCPISNVTFEASCRNNWHRHSGGQVLVVISGRGIYQARGEKARELLPGDVVEIASGVEHWHGAAPDGTFSHLAIEANPQTNENTWLEAVDDACYAAAVASLK